MNATVLRLGIGLVCMLLAAIGSMPLWQKAAMGFGDYRISRAEHGPPGVITSKQTSFWNVVGCFWNMARV